MNTSESPKERAVEPNNPLPPADRDSLILRILGRKIEKMAATKAFGDGIHALRLIAEAIRETEEEIKPACLESPAPAHHLSAHEE